MRELTHRLARWSSARGRMDQLGELDAASQEMTTGVVRALEEQVSMVRARLPGPRES